MDRRVEAARQGGAIDWAIAAKSYFDWRRSLVPTIAFAERPSQNEAPEVHWEHMRLAAESAIRARLIDPSSAEFSWPYGFVFGYWKPFLGGKQSGEVTCGEVNSRNRFGGYVGASPFVVVVNGSSVTYIEIAEKRDFDFTRIGCQKFVASLPAWRHTVATSQAAAASVSVADELAKLADLRAKGLLSDEEFAAAKAKALAR
jgi:hypothetical protein